MELWSAAAFVRLLPVIGPRCPPLVFAPETVELLLFCLHNVIMFELIAAAFPQPSFPKSVCQSLTQTGGEEATPTFQSRSIDFIMITMTSEAAMSEGAEQRRNRLRATGARKVLVEREILKIQHWTKI